MHYEMDQNSSLINISQFQNISGKVAATNFTSSGKKIALSFYFAKEVIIKELPADFTLIYAE